LKKSPKLKNLTSNPIANIPLLVKAVDEHIVALSQLNNKTTIKKPKRKQYYGKYTHGRYII